MQEATGYPEPVLKLRELLNTYLDPEKVAIIMRAYDVGESAHRGQTR
jgi:guanosine-3',5'-bis(diphosphate) 3'-pyrophosphohydrolase